jgi:hypothetical protein
MCPLDVLEAPNVLCLKGRLIYLHVLGQLLGFSVLCVPECSLDVSMCPGGSGIVLFNDALIFKLYIASAMMERRKVFPVHAMRAC